MLLLLLTAIILILSYWLLLLLLTVVVHRPTYKRVPTPERLCHLFFQFGFVLLVKRLSLIAIPLTRELKSREGISSILVVLAIFAIIFVPVLELLLLVLFLLIFHHYHIYLYFQLGWNPREFNPPFFVFAQYFLSI